MEFSWRQLARCFIASFLLFSAPAIRAADPLTLVGQWSVPLPEAPDRRTQVVGNREYRALGSVGLQILDISTSAQPVVLGTYRDPLGRALAVVVTNDLAFVAYGERELQIINVANPASPFRVNGFYATNRPPGGSYGTPAVVASDLALAGDLVYLADGLSGLQIVNVSEPSSPVSVGIYQTAQAAASVTVKGTTATVATESTEFDLDVSNSATPRLVSTRPTLVSAKCVAVKGSIVVAGFEGRSVEILNVSDPGAPRSVGRLPIEGRLNDIELSGETVLLAKESTAAGVQIIDISDPSNPRTAATFATRNNPFGVAMEGTRGYVAAGTDLYILDLSTPATPGVLGRYEPAIPCYRVTVAGDLAFLAKWNGGPLEIVNLSDPANPVSLGTLPVDGHECVVRDGKAYVSSDSGLSVFDVSNPTEPRFLGASTNAGQLVIGKGLVVSGSYVFMGNNLGGLAAFELNAMDVPKQIASYAHSSWADSVAMSGDFIFAPDYGTGVKIYRNDNAGLRLKLSPAAFQVLNATPGGRYVLERTVGLSAPGSWTPLATNTIQNYTASFPTTASGGDREFFRLRKTE